MQTPPRVFTFFRRWRNYSGRYFFLARKFRTLKNTWDFEKCVSKLQQIEEHCLKVETKNFFKPKYRYGMVLNTRERKGYRISVNYRAPTTVMAIHFIFIK